MNIKKIIFFIYLVTLFCIVLVSMTGEKVAYNDGAGWDGLFYRNVMYDFDSQILSHGYDSYRIQRILPFGTANVFFNLFSIIKTDDSLMAAIQVLNFFALAAGVLYFFLIINEMRLSLPVSIIGFAALFFNYPILKLMGYYPFLTDTYAIVIAIIQFFYFIKKRRIVLIVLSIIGAFTWPTLFLSGLILAFFPNTKINLSEDLNKSDKSILTIIKTFFIIGLPSLFLLAYMIKGDKLMQFYSGARFSNYTILVFSLFCVALYMYLLLKPINISIYSNVKKFFHNFGLYNIICFIIIYLGVKVTITILSNGKTLISTTNMMIARLLVPPTVDPFIFLICNFMYYGFIIFFFIFFWKDSINTYAEYGYSLFIIISLGLVMTINTESRHLLSFVPFMVFPLLKLLSKINNKKINMVFAVIFSLASLILSRFWYRINVPGIEKAFMDPFENNIGSYQDFPAQRYFMAHGPWMSHEMYYIFLGIFIISLACFAVYFNIIPFRSERRYERGV